MISIARHQAYRCLAYYLSLHRLRKENKISFSIHRRFISVHNIARIFWFFSASCLPLQANENNKNSSCNKGTSSFFFSTLLSKSFVPPYFFAPPIFLFSSYYCSLKNTFVRRTHHNIFFNQNTTSTGLSRVLVFSFFISCGCIFVSAHTLRKSYSYCTASNHVLPSSSYYSLQHRAIIKFYFPTFQKKHPA